MEQKTIDIHSKGDYPANVLSNFYPNEFELDGVRCASMEGFLQSLKFKNPKKQEMAKPRVAMIKPPILNACLITSSI